MTCIPNRTCSLWNVFCMCVHKWRCRLLRAFPIARMCVFVCVCVCACACMCLSVSVHVCVWERERECVCVCAWSLRAFQIAPCLQQSPVYTIYCLWSRGWLKTIYTMYVYIHVYIYIIYIYMYIGWLNMHFETKFCQPPLALNRLANRTCSHKNVFCMYRVLSRG